jgi:hyperosmotically inducible periplasmic protein
MRTRSRTAILMMCTVLSIGLLPMVWMGCASTATRESTGEYIDDSTITAKLKTAFATDPTVSALAVHVKTYKGTVQLSGFVNSQAEKDKAAEIARGVRGVQAVTNSLIVKTK